MILLLARYHIADGKRDEVVGQIREMKARVEETEPACLAYDVWQSQDDPDVLVLHEVYADQAGVDAHRETAHFKEIVEGRIVPNLKNRAREFFDPALDT
ncbi:putative quinol monooxygenase [Roseitranquillus sediminis]|uniref:putative quinol monooxygenase n=1 Tax=Roseitranquillus sediminis TaxID=2809051 RepID=UPI001D0CD70B|nr:putative quinol monooxygenase [Roseitranquillus sediminis]MBM9596020.1 antibiotic biosynthesis monooxygenase [Roseitranquillus sediminis]